MITKFLFLIIGIAVSIPAFAGLQEMTLEEKVGQLLMVHFNGETANDDARRLIQKSLVGGIIYYNWANGLHSPRQVRQLSAGLQALSKQNRNPIPLFIAVDQEGGVVARLTKGFTVFPGNKALGMTNDPGLAEKCSFAMGQELKCVGVNFNLSPVIDVNTNPRNPVIGIRSFGGSPDTVVCFGKSALHGYHKAGIITSLKHFPGHGNVEVDSHSDLPVLKQSREQLQAVELLPFFELAPQADTIMTAHIIVPSIDPVHCATLSKDVLDIVRKEIGFQGVIISDSLVMEGLLKNCSPIDDAAIRALNAGCDILLLGGKQLVDSKTHLELKVADIERIHQAVVNAVKNGIVSEQRLNEAVRRILALKNAYLLSGASNDECDLKGVGTPEKNQLAINIAALSLKEIKNSSTLPSPGQQKIAIFAPAIVQDSIKQVSHFSSGKETPMLFFRSLNPDEAEMQLACNMAVEADVLIMCSYNAWKNQSQVTLFQALLNSKKPVIVIVLRDPVDASSFPQADLILMTFSPTAPSIQAAFDRLFQL